MWWGSSRGSDSEGRLAISERLARLEGDCFRFLAAMSERMASTAAALVLPPIARKGGAAHG